MIGRALMVRRISKSPQAMSAVECESLYALATERTTRNQSRFLQEIGASEDFFFLSDASGGFESMATNSRIHGIRTPRAITRRPLKAERTITNSKSTSKKSSKAAAPKSKQSTTQEKVAKNKSKSPNGVANATTSKEKKKKTSKLKKRCLRNSTKDSSKAKRESDTCVVKDKKSIMDAVDAALPVELFTVPWMNHTAFKDDLVEAVEQLKEQYTGARAKTYRNPIRSYPRGVYTAVDDVVAATGSRSMGTHNPFAPSSSRVSTSTTYGDKTVTESYGRGSFLQETKGDVGNIAVYSTQTTKQFAKTGNKIIESIASEEVVPVDQLTPEQIETLRKQGFKFAKRTVLPDTFTPIQKLAMKDVYGYEDDGF
ncbi:unnamed protein product [Nippostrongylus brasiliensis]|uniref:Uncharacterized protein n=1 Tax=Nippostrongylus brasiliensis TaxID=27835 RepID=A0A0N4YFV2_NIPBR|nr:unnamed protein product [Nippostrongylus brasiliensis]